MGNPFIFCFVAVPITVIASSIAIGDILQPIGIGTLPPNLHIVK